MGLPIPPDKDIGPFYKILAGFLTVVMGVLLLLHEYGRRDNTWIDLSIIGVLACFILALTRPDWFDRLVKTVADALPFLRFRKDDS